MSSRFAHVINGIGFTLTLFVASGCQPAATGGPGFTPAEPAPQAGCSDPGDRDVPDAHESALRLAPTSTSTFCNTPDGDVDMFAVAVPEGTAGVLLRYKVAAGAGMSPAMTIYDGARAEVHQNRAEGREIRGWAHVAGATTVYLQVSSGNVGGPGDTYVISLETTPVDEPSEPNPSWEAATKLQLGATASGVLGNALNDATLAEDWYEFIMPPSRKVKVVVDMSPGVSFLIDVHDASRKTVAGVGAGAGERAEVEVKSKPGKHYVKVVGTTIPHSTPREGTGDLPAFLTKPYTITITP